MNLPDIFKSFKTNGKIVPAEQWILSVDHEKIFKDFVADNDEFITFSTRGGDKHRFWRAELTSYCKKFWQEPVHTSAGAEWVDATVKDPQYEAALLKLWLELKLIRDDTDSTSAPERYRILNKLT